MSLAQEVLTGGMGASRELITKVSGVMILGGTAFKAVAKVSEGEMGVRTHYGRAHRIRGRRSGELYGIVEPGYHPVFPFTHSIKTISVQDRSNDLGELQVDREDKQYRVMSSITWFVSKEGDNPYRAIFNILNEGDLTQAVTNICLSGLREVMAEIPDAKLKNRREVQGGVSEICSDDLGYYGVLLKRLNLHSVTPTIGEMLRPTGQFPPPPRMGALAVAAEVTPELLRAVE